MNQRLSLALLAALFVAPVGLEAQVSGIVRTSGGVALEGVAVEGWVGDRRIAATTTNSFGRFLLGDSTVVFDELRAGALGFLSASVAVREGVTSYEITLEEEPLLLDGLEVVLEGDVCLRDDDDGARGLWEHARAYYHQSLDTLGIATYLAEADTVVAREEIGPLRLPELALNQRSSASILRFSWDRRVKRDGYAFKVRRSDGRAAYDSWVYAPLEADFTPHFVGELFGDRNKFVDPVQDAEGWTATFCPRDDDDPGIRGTLVFARDTTLTSVEWSFLTPEPVERAGGRVIFGPVTPGTMVYPLPTEALVWKQETDGRYFQQYQRYEGWRVVPGDSVPQLPLRRGGDSGS